MQSQWFVDTPVVCVSAVNTLLSVRADRPYRLQQDHWCDTTCTFLLASLLSCQSFYFCLSSPYKSAKNLKPIKAGQIGFTCKVITSKDSPFRDAWKAIQWSSTMKREHTVFHINFSSVRHFFLLGYWFQNENTCGCVFTLLAHKKYFLHWLSMFIYLVIALRCSATLLISPPGRW